LQLWTTKAWYTIPCHRASPILSGFAVYLVPLMIDHNDNMILDWQNGYSPSGFGHPSCKGGTQSDGIIRNLSKDSQPVPEEDDL
jgi:hypothetical protein